LINEAAFQTLAEKALSELPQRFLDMIENVAVFTEDWPSADVMENMGLASPGELMGLYQGWPLPDRGVSYTGQLPDMIHLYRRPILSFCNETGESVERCVRHVLVHEIGHHFGFTDEEMEAIECQKV
jgi:predicted Zn-dependent protease with MMP-like domain